MRSILVVLAFFSMVRTPCPQSPEASEVVEELPAGRSIDAHKFLLLRSDRKDVVPAVREAIEDLASGKEADARGAAGLLWVVEALGPAAADLVPMLIELTKAENLNVGIAAVGALGATLPYESPRDEVLTAMTAIETLEHRVHDAILCKPGPPLALSQTPGPSLRPIHDGLRSGRPGRAHRGASRDEPFGHPRDRRPQADELGRHPDGEEAGGARQGPRSGGWRRRPEPLAIPTQGRLSMAAGEPGRRGR